MKKQVKDMLRLKRWAVLGASANPHKFGYRIFKLLRRYGYETYPVNPKETVIDGEACFSSLKELPVIPDVVDLVVPPSVALEALVECKLLGVKNVWLQPGVNTPEVIAKAQALGLTVIFDACAMVESSKLVMLQKKTWAVVDASDGQKDEAALLSKQLQQQGYSVFMFTHEEAASGSFLASLSPKPEVVLVTGRPFLTAGVLQACKSAGIDSVWLQPRAETEEIIALGLSLNLVIVHHAGVIEELKDILGV